MGPLGDPVNPIGVKGISVTGEAVNGTTTSVTFAAVTGYSQNPNARSGAGVWGHSEAVEGVRGETNSPASAAVGGYALQANGFGAGVYGASSGKGPGVLGISASAAGVMGTSTTGAGVQGVSGSFDGVNGTSASPQHAGVAASNSVGGFGVWAKAKTAGHFEGLVEVLGDLSVANVNATGDLHAVNVNLTGDLQAVNVNLTGDLQAANVNVTGDVVLTGANDCAESFDVAADPGAEPGAVMILDENGGLRVSDRGYDKKVAGVISGAGNFRPGLILDGCKEEGDSSRMRMPLALMGRVYCKVDAEYAPVEIGDLLTSSPTRGHAMKASDPSLAFGTVIGKALRPLVAGQGLIPILVALQ
jgi:hypothetical protein